MHGCSSASTAKGPARDSLPATGSLAAWRRAGRSWCAEVAAELGLGGEPRRAGDQARASKACSSASSARRRGASRGAFEPWLLEAGFGEDEDSERPALEIDGWRLHGAIDRVDRAADGRALVHDYKVGEQGDAGEEARGGREAPAPALPARGRRALGRRRRSAPSITRCAATSRAAAPGPGPRGRGGGPGRPRAGRHRPTSSGGVRGRCSRRPAAGGRDRRADAERRDQARSRPAAAAKEPRRLPRLLRLRADLPSRPGPPADEERDREDELERAAADARAGGRDRGRAGRRHDRGRGRGGQDRGDGRSLLPARLRGGCRRSTRSSRSPSPTRRRAELRQRIRAELAGRADGGSERARRAARQARQRLDHDHPRLLPPPARLAIRWPPGVDPRFHVLDAAEADRAAREAFDEALEEFLAGDDEAGEETVAAYGIDALRGMVVGAHEELRSRGDRQPPACPSRPTSDVAGALREAERGRDETLSRAEREEPHPATRRAGDRDPRRARRGDRPWTRSPSCAATATARKRWPPTERRSRRR